LIAEVGDRRLFTRGERKMEKVISLLALGSASGRLAPRPVKKRKEVGTTTLLRPFVQECARAIGLHL